MQVVSSAAHVTTPLPIVLTFSLRDELATAFATLTLKVLTAFLWRPWITTPVTIIVVDPISICSHSYAQFAVHRPPLSSIDFCERVELE